eukprot:6180845-Pleurochrysis_carterae.AAC.1
MTIDGSDDAHICPQGVESYSFMDADAGPRAGTCMSSDEGDSEDDDVHPEYVYVNSSEEEQPDGPAASVRRKDDSSDDDYEHAAAEDSCDLP